MERFRRAHFLVTVFGLLCAAIGSAVGILQVPLVLRLILVSTELMGLVQSYLRVVLLDLPSAFLYNLYSALLRSVGVNLWLDVFFVSGLGMGIQGAAWATVIAQVFSVALSSEGDQFLARCAKALTCTAARLLMDLQLLVNAREEFETGLIQVLKGNLPLENEIDRLLVKTCRFLSMEHPDNLDIFA